MIVVLANGNQFLPYADRKTIRREGGKQEKICVCHAEHHQSTGAGGKASGGKSRMRKRTLAAFPGSAVEKCCFAMMAADSASKTILLRSRHPILPRDASSRLYGSGSASWAFPGSAISDLSQFFPHEIQDEVDEFVHGGGEFVLDGGEIIGFRLAVVAAVLASGSAPTAGNAPFRIPASISAVSGIQRSGGAFSGSHAGAKARPSGFLLDSGRVAGAPFGRL